MIASTTAWSGLIRPGIGACHVLPHLRRSLLNTEDLRLQLHRSSTDQRQPAADVEMSNSLCRALRQMQQGLRVLKLNFVEDDPWYVYA